MTHRAILLAGGLLAGSLLAAGAGTGAPAQPTTPAAPLPPRVAATEEHAEDIIDDLLAGHWDRARAAADSILASEDAVAGAMRAAGLPLSTIDDLGYFTFRLRALAGEAKEPIWAAITANQISGLLIDLEGRHALPQPVEIAWMDYLGREVYLWPRVAGSGRLVERRLAQLEATWQALRPRVLDRHGGPEAVAKVDRVLADLGGASSPERMIAAGQRLLDLVDELEGLFG